MNLERKACDDRRKGMPIYPAQTLAMYTAAKGAQLGSVSGLATTAILTFCNRIFVKNRPKLWHRIMVPQTLLGAAVTSSLLYYQHINNELDEGAVDERAYRIATDTEGVQIGRYSLAGLVSGSVGGVIIGRHLLSCSCTGLGLGFAFYYAEKMFIANKNSKTVEMYAPKWITRK